MKKNKVLATALISALLLFAHTQPLCAQPVNIVKAPKYYTNPVVIVIPKGPLVTKDQDVEVTLYYINNNSGKLTRIMGKGDSINSSAVRLKASMHVRGTSTANNIKKQYAVKLKQDPPAGSNFLGMTNKGKEWIFNDCGAVDFTLVRNTVTFTAQNALDQYAPQWKWFELFLCSDTSSVAHMSYILSHYYQGLYLNFDKIEFSPERVNLPYKKHKINGDYAILQLNPLDTSKYLPLPLNASSPVPLTPPMQVYEPKRSDIDKYAGSAQVKDTLSDWYYSSTGTSWAGQMANCYNNYINTANDTVGFSAALARIRKITDYQSFAVYFLLNELCKDPDGYEKSTFMVKNKNVCQAGPLWDKNKSYANTANNTDTSSFYNNAQGWLYYHSAYPNEDPNQGPAWWHVMLKDSMFCKAVWNIWQQQNATGGYLNDTTLNVFIAKQVNYINKPYVEGNKDTTSALRRNNYCWQSAYNMTMAGYMAQVQQLTSYITARIAWMKSNLPALLSASGFRPQPGSKGKARMKKAAPGKTGKKK